MSFFFGKSSKTKPTYTGLQLQTASSTEVITLLWGGNRLAMNIFWYDDFTAHKKKQKAGKGMGGSSTYYTYSASIQGGLCEGPISGVGVVYKDDEKTTLAKLGMTLFTGTYPQAPWGYLTTKHPTKALHYEGVSYVAIANYDLGQSASMGNHTFETFGLNYDTAPLGHDADCAIVVKDFLTNEQYGAGFGLSRLDEDQLFSTAEATTTGDSSYQTYCTAMGFGMSPLLSSQSEAGTILAQWALLTNSAIVWNGYKLKLIPYVREVVTGNGVTYNPPQLDEPAYTLTDDDFLADPTFERVDQSDCPNVVTMTINNRFNEYNELPVPYKDQTLIDQFGERKGNDIAAPEITDPDMAAEMVSLVAARAAYVRNIYKIVLGQEYVLLEPMDVVEVVNSSGSVLLLQITNIEEDDDSQLIMECEEIANDVSARSGYTNPGTAQPVIINSGVTASPVNPPILFEPAANLTNGIAQVWAAVSGGDGTTADPNWGGAVVYISTDDITYQAVGTIDSPARQGKLTANMSTGSGATASVSLLMSAGELQSVTADEAADGATLSIVGTELFSYEGATLTGTNAYNLTDLVRGMYGTVDEAHLSNVPFARLDDNIFKYNLPIDYIGKTLYLKFQSFNIWDSGYQDMEDLVAYTYTPDGNGFRINPPASINLSFASTVQTDGTTVLKGTVTIGASPGPYLDHYDIEISPDDGATWQGISAINASGTNTSFQPALSSTDYKARARAVSSAVGGIPSNWVTTPTVNSGSLGGTAPNIPTSFAGVGGILSNSLTWVAPVAGSIPTSYRIYGKLGHSGAFSDTTLVGSVGYGQLKFVHVGLGPEEDWRYFIKAANGAGESAAVGPVDLTTTNEGGGSVAIQDEGTPILASATTLNFVGSGVSVVEDPTGVAKVTIEGGSGTAAFELLASAVGTGVSQDITIPSGYEEDQLLVFSGALFFPDFTLSGTTLTLTTNAAGDQVKIYSMVAGATIGEGYLGYQSIPRFRPNAGVGFGFNNYGGRVVTFDRKCKITHVSGYCVTSSPTSVVRPALYSVNPANGTINTLLVQGPQVTGVSPGLFDLPLDSEYPVEAGDTVFVGFQVLTANLSLAQQGETTDTFFFASTGALPSTAPSATYGGATSMTIFPKVSVSGGGGGGLPWYWDPPLASEFTLANSTAPNLVLVDDDDIGLSLDGGTPVSGDEQRVAYIPLPSPTTPWEMTVGFQSFFPNTNYSSVGLIAWDGTGGRNYLFELANANDIVTTRMSALGSYNNAVSGGTPLVGCGDLTWLRISFTGTQYIFYYSPNGKKWFAKDTVSISDYLANPANRVGIATRTNRSGGMNIYAAIKNFSLTGGGL